MRWILADAGLPDAALLRGVQADLSGEARFTVRLRLLTVGYLCALVAGTTVIHLSVGDLSQTFIAVYLPTTVAQTILSVLIFAHTLHLSASFHQARRWDVLRVTPDGVALTFRAFWAEAVYFRLRGSVGLLLYAPRLLLLALLIYDATGFRHEYLAIIANAHTPILPPLTEIPLIAMLITAAFALPLTSLGLEAAVGLYLSTYTRRLRTVLFILIPLILARMLWTGAALWAAYHVLLDGVASPEQGWLTLLGVNALVDWGVSGLHLPLVDRVWTAIPYSALLGPVLLGLAALHTVLTALLLRLAARRMQYS